MNLDERISKLGLYQYVADECGGVSVNSINEIKQLLRDVLEYVKPDRNKPRVDTYHDPHAWNWGFSAACEEFEDKQRELGL